MSHIYVEWYANKKCKTIFTTVLHSYYSKCYIMFVCVCLYVRFADCIYFNSTTNAVFAFMVILLMSTDCSLMMSLPLVYCASFSA